MQIIIRVVRSVCSLLFGNIQWVPPRWLTFILGILTWPFVRVAKSYWGLRATNRPRFRKITGAAFAAALVVAGGYSYYRSLPEPHKVAFELTLPEPTSFEKDSKPNPLIVRFSGSAAPVVNVGKAVTKGITVSPQIDGTWTWTQDNELVLRPTVDWDVGKDYTVHFDRSFLARGVLLEENSFKFRSPSFVATASGGEFYEDPTNPQNKQVVLTVRFTHPVNKSEFEKRVRMKMRVEPVKNFDDKSVRQLGFKTVYKDDGSEAYVRSEALAIPDRDGEVLTTIDDGVVAARGGSPSTEKASYSIAVPGVESYFKILSVSPQVVTNQKTYEAEKILTIESTAGVEQKEFQNNVEVFLLPTDPKLYAGIESDAADEVEEECEGEDCGSEEGEEESTEKSSCPLSSAGQVTDEIMKKAQRLPVTWIPSEHEYEKLQNAKYEAPDNSCLLVKIKKGTKANGGYQLVSSPSFLVTSGPYPPDLQIMHKGALMSITGEKKLSIMSRNLSLVHFKLYRVLPNSIHHLTSVTYGPYQEPYFYGSFGPENISEVFESTVTVPPTRPGRPSYSMFDFGTYLATAPAQPKGLFILEASGWDEATKSVQHPMAKRLVLMSDLGFLVKGNQNGTQDLFVLSLREKIGVAGALVQVLGKNGIPVFEGTTNEAGRVSLPVLKDFEREKAPTVYVVQKDGDLSYMPYSQGDRQLSFSRFDVGGLYTYASSESLQGYLFSDRGIYRPGETTHIGMIVKTTSWQSLPPGLPLQLSITDPRGIEIRRESVKFGPDGFEEFTHVVPDSALTGAYECSLSLVKKGGRTVLLGSTSIRVEEFLPDRLKVSATLSEEPKPGWLTPAQLKGRATLYNLFGTPAVGNRIKGKLWISPASFAFAKYPNFFFYDALRPKDGATDELGEVETDAKGEAEFDFHLERFEAGTYRLSYAVEGFEKESGRSVSANISAVVSPLPFIVGVKVDGDRAFIRKGQKVKAQFIAVDQSANQTLGEDLELELIERRFVSTLTKLSSGSLAYQSVEKKISREKKNVSIPKEGLTLELPANEPGDYFYELRNKSGTVLSSFLFSVVGDADRSRDLEREAELQMKLAKTDYAPGEEIEFEIQAPYTGSGLITIERDKIYAHKWFSTDTTSSIQKITLPEGLEGNGYVNVAFVRSLDSPEIYTAPLSYGVQPFTVSRDRRTEKIKLEAPEQIKPGDTLGITVSTPENARTAVFAVDEGILQVARYKTPDPLSIFFQKRALEVTTSQILDLLLPEFQLVQRLAATGGDDDALLSRHRNPFKRKSQKPVVYWSGILGTSPTPQTLNVPIPDYFNGSVKVFSLSVSPTRIGVAERKTTVQGDIVLTPNVPLVAAPGDEFEVSTIITNLRGGGENVHVKLAADDKVTIVSPAEQDLTIPLGKDAPAFFRVKANDILGSGNLVFSAKGASSEAKYSIDLSVRPSSPMMTTVQFGTLRAGLFGTKSADLSVKRNLYPEEAEKSFSASTLPLGLARGLQQYLEKYPHGCSEQIISQAYPTLILGNRPEFGFTKDQMKKSLDRAVGVLGSRQKENGSFRIWPGVDGDDTWLSLHIARFLLEAKERNQQPPAVLYEQTMNFVRSIANGNEISLEGARNRAYAIYILTRDGMVTTNYLQALREGLEKESDLKWRSDITALFMASTYSLLKLDSDAAALKKKVTADPATQGLGTYYDGLSHTGHVLALLSRHFPEDAKALKAEVFTKIADELLNKHYSTISSATLILGLDEYQRVFGSPEGMGLKVSVSSDLQKFEPLSLPDGPFPVRALPLAVQAVRVDAHEKGNIFYQTEESGFDRSIGENVSSKLEIFREYTREDGTPIHSASVGSDVRVRIVVRTLDANFDPGQVAVVDLLPAGFELVGGTTALTGDATQSSSKWYPSFVDAREDRALMYGVIDNSAREYTYTVKAVSKGKFVVPPVFVEAMYDQSAYARSSAGEFTVE